MGNAQKRCYDMKARLKKSKNAVKIIDNTDENNNTINTNNGHQINIIIKKTRKPSLDKKKFLSNTMLPKNKNMFNITNITSNKSSRLMNSFDIINSSRRFQSPTNSLNKNKKINLSPLKKVKKSSTIKNIYLKGDLIGQGRFGKVYPGLCTLNGEIATLKVYENISEEKKKLILKNKKQICKLDHENIVKTILLYEEKEELIAVFDCSNLNSVQDLINEYGSFDEIVIQEYSRQLLQGLKYLHEQNIYHKNFTPKNVLVDSEGKIKISDCYIDSIIFGSAKELYDNLLSKSNNKIEYYIPPFFIQNIFYFGESMAIKISENENNNNKIDAIKFFEDWQAFDLWYMGCFLIEISSGKKPWNHYNFKDNTDFFGFLRNTNLIPTIPKKMSLEFHELVQILLNPTLTNKKNIYDIIFNLNFFTKNVKDFIYQTNNKSMIQSSFKTSRIEKKNFEDSSCFADSNILLGQVLQNNKVKNILNNNNNASFSVTSMEDISFSNSAISNNLFNSSLSYQKNEFKSFIEGKINKIKSIKSIKSDMTEVKEVQTE